MAKKIISGLVLLAMIVNLFAVPAFADPAQPETAGGLATTTQVSADYRSVVSNNVLELYVNEKLGAIAVKDKSSGYFWYSAVPADTYSRDGLTEVINDQLNSLFSLTYTLLNENDAKTFTFPVNNLKPTIKAENITNGVRLRYNIDSVNIEMCVDITLDGQSVDVSLPADQMTEGKGTTDKLNQYLKIIDTFIEDCYKALDEVEALGISANKNSIKNSRAQLAELKTLTESLDSVVGVAYAYSRAKVILLDTLQIYLFGGKEGEPGIYKRIADSSKVPQDKKSYFASQKSKLDDDLEYASYCFGLLKSVKYGGIVNVDMMPNFGATADNESGYVFYPDGSGALTYNKPQHGQVSDVFTASIYSEQTVDMAWENERDSTGVKRIMLPVYGAKKNDHAFLANIVGGDTSASICFLPSGNTVNLNRIYSQFQFRNKIQVTSSSEYSSGMATIYEKSPLKINPKIKYHFLNGDQASYSGMANTYRQYLLDNSMIKKSKLLDQTEMPLALDFVGGTLKSLLFFNSYVPLSTFGEMGQVLDELKAQNISNVYLHLSDWTKDLSTPTDFKIPKAAGGSEGLKQLVEKSKQLGGNVFLQTDMIDADIWGRSVNQSKLALDSNLRIFEFETYWYKLFSPLYIQNNVPTTIKQLEKLGNPGVSQIRMGTLIYFDYNSKYKADRQQTMEIWQKIYQDMSANSPMASYGGNQYLLQNNDWLMDIPMSSSGYTFTDQSVPFYQMVVHGLIPYSAKPFNHFYDKDKEKLQTIEYGCMPLYKLTYRDSTDLRKIYYGFTTPYDTVKDGIVETYKEFDEKLSQFTDQYMVNHQKLTDDVTVVTYSNNKKIYINYGTAPYSVDGITVPPVNYVIG